MIVYGIATETSIGRLFLAGLLPGLMLTVFFMVWTIYRLQADGPRPVGADPALSPCASASRALPRVLPFLAIIAGVLYVLYGGIATPSEAAGVGALFCLVLVAVVYGVFSNAGSSRQMPEIFRDTLKESVMIMLIIGASELFAFALSSLFITQSIAQCIADLDVNR